MEVFSRPNFLLIIEPVFFEEWSNVQELFTTLLSQLPVALILLGGVTLLFEATIPGGPFFVAGFAMLCSGIFGFMTGITEPWILGAMALVAGAIGLVVYRRIIGLSSETDQSSDADAITGATGTVTETITSDGNGEIYLPNAKRSGHYRAQSQSGTIEEGTAIKVVDPRGGSLLLVERLEE
jgi:membrane protein implicated in regulation of membrane protease activity